MHCSTSRKDYPITALGLWMLHHSRIRTAAEFAPIKKRLYQVKYADLAAEIAKIKGGAQ